jgi:hypothetical protein
VGTADIWAGAGVAGGMLDSDWQLERRDLANNYTEAMCNCHDLREVLKRDGYGCKFLTVLEPGIQRGSWRRNAIWGISDIGLKLMDEADWRRSSLQIYTYGCI